MQTPTQPLQTPVQPAPPVAPAAPAPSTPKPAVTAVEEKTPPTNRRQFMREDEETLVKLWQAHIDAYFNGIRRRVLDKMTCELNETLDGPPLFHAKQVANKLSYMERRYRAVREELRRQQSSPDDAPPSVRAAVERRFCLFYPVHAVLRGMCDNAGAELDDSDMAGVVDAKLWANENGGKRILEDDTVKSGESSQLTKRARTVERDCVSMRVAGVLERMVAMSENMLEADRMEREGRLAHAKHAAQVRMREIELMDKNANVRLAESHNTSVRERMEALKFLAAQMADSGDAPGRARVLRQLEDLTKAG